MKRILYGLILALALAVFPLDSQAQTNPARGFIATNGAATCVTAGSCVRMDSLPFNSGSVGIQITNTYTGTLSFESTVDGSNYVAAQGCTGSSGAVSSTTSTGQFQCPVGGLSGFQVRGSASITGQAVVVILASLANPAGGTSAVTVSGIATEVTLAKTILDPCNGVAKVSVPVDIVTATTTVLVAASASNKVYICSIVLYTDAANDVGIVEDATGSCASPDAGIFGGVTAAEGFNFAANQGFVAAGGSGMIAKTASTNVNVCAITSAATQLNGALVYAFAP